MQVTFPLVHKDSMKLLQRFFCRLKHRFCLSDSHLLVRGTLLVRPPIRRLSSSIRDRDWKDPGAYEKRGRKGVR